MDIIAFLRLVLPSGYAYFMQTFYLSGEKPTTKALSLEHLDMLVNQAVAGNPADIYISMAGFAADTPTYIGKKTGRQTQYAVAHKSHYIDIDCGDGKPYRDQDEILDALDAFIDATGLPYPLTVSSGHGVHAYWPYTTELTESRWLLVAGALRAVCEHAGLHIDEKLTTNQVCLLRPLGTFNLKRGGRAPVALVYDDDIDYAALDQRTVATALHAYMTQHDVPMQQVHAAEPEADDLNSDLGAGMDTSRPPYTMQQMADEGCKFVRWYKFNGGDAFPDLPIRMSNPDWVTLARVAHYAEGGDAWFIEHGRKYKGMPGKGWNEPNAQRLLREAKHAGVYCNTLVTDHAARREICGRCQFRDEHQFSPIHLGEPRPQPREDIPSEDLQQPESDMEFDAMPPDASCPSQMTKLGYAHTKDGTFITKALTKKAKPTRFFVSHYSIVKMTKLAETSGIHHYIVKFKSAVHDRVAEVEFSGRDFASSPHIIIAGKLGEADITYSNKETIMTYIRDWMNSIAAQASVPAATQMGWQPDGSFVVGHDSYKNGEHQRAQLIDTLVAINTEAIHYEPVGTLAGQQRALHALFPNHPDFTPAHVAIIGALVPLLLDEERIPSPTVSMYSLESGHGKTLAQKALLGVWGNPEKTELKGSGSPIALVNRLGIHRTLPIVIDEMTGPDAMMTFNIINLVQGNKTPDKATAFGGLRQTFEWRTAAYLSTNEPIRQKLQSVPNVTDGVAMRLIEFHYTNPTVKQSLHEVDKKMLFENYGWLGREAIRLMQRDMPAVRKQFQHDLKTFREINNDNNGGERIWHHWFAAELTMAHFVINVWHLLDFNYEAIKLKLFDYLKEQRTDYQRSSPDMFTRLKDVLWELTAIGGLRVEADEPATGSTLYPKAGNVNNNANQYVRQVDSTGLTYVHQKAFRKAAGAYADMILEYALKHRLLTEPKPVNFRLASHTGRADTPTRCYIFNQKLIDVMSTEQNKREGSAVVDTGYEEERTARPRSPAGAAHLRPVK